MSTLPFLALASFMYFGISSSLNMEHRIPNQKHINWSDDKKSFIVFPGNGTSNSSTLKIKKFCKDVNGYLLCTTVGKSQNITQNAQDMRHRRAAEKEKEKKNLYFEADAASSCFVPELDTAEIRCKVMPSSIICNSYCIYGYTYEEGIARSLSCKFSENVWTPYFDECSPFIDCDLKLVTPGSLKCWGNKVNESPKCEIECDIYEDQDALPKQVYKCKTDGSWDPSMPFCAQPKGLKTLANAPQHVDQYELDYP